MLNKNIMSAMSFFIATIMKQTFIKNCRMAHLFINERSGLVE